MKFTFDDKNPSKILQISKEFEGLHDPTLLEITLKRICKEYRILPNGIGVLDNVVLRTPCGICDKQKPYKCKVRTLSCGHCFHDRCITNWLIENKLKCRTCSKCVVNNND